MPPHRADLGRVALVARVALPIRRRTTLRVSGRTRLLPGTLAHTLVVLLITCLLTMKPATMDEHIETKVWVAVRALLKRCWGVAF